MSDTKTYEYEVTTCTGDGGSCSDTVDEVVSYVHNGSWVQFFGTDGLVVAEFRADAVVSIIRVSVSESAA